MNKRTRNLSEKNKELLTSGFFSAPASQFEDFDQNIWLNFATFATNITLEHFQANLTQLSIYDVLTLIGKLRFDLSEIQNHQVKNNNLFGAWRNNETGSNFLSLKNAIKKNRQLETNSSFDVKTFHDFYSKSSSFFDDIKSNLETSRSLDNRGIRVRKPSTLESKLIIDFLKQNEGFKVTPETFYEVATFVNFAFIDTGPNDSEQVFTSYYFTDNLKPYFLISDHPQPDFFKAFIKDRLDLIFLDCINPAVPGQEKLHCIAELVWFGHQLMPFQRGTASVFLILTAALLIHNSIAVKPYPGVRLDIDALSLSKKLFVQKFIENYA